MTMEVFNLFGFQCTVGVSPRNDNIIKIFPTWVSLACDTGRDTVWSVLASMEFLSNPSIQGFIKLAHKFTLGINKGCAESTFLPIAIAIMKINIIVIVINSKR